MLSHPLALGICLVELIVIAILRNRMIVERIREPEQQPVSVWPDIEQIDISRARKQLAIHHSLEVMKVGKLYSIAIRSALKELYLLCMSESLPKLSSLSRSNILAFNRKILSNILLHLIPYLVDIRSLELSTTQIDIAVVALIQRVSDSHINLAEDCVHSL